MKTTSAQVMRLAGLATAVPDRAVSQDEVSRLAIQCCCGRSRDNVVSASRLRRLFRHAHVSRRYFVIADDDAAESAANGALSFYPQPSAADDRGPTTAQRMVRYEAEAIGLAVSAADKALAKSGVAPGAITHLVTVSCTGFAAPGIDIGLVGRLGLSPSVVRTHIGFMGCHGLLNGLRVAATAASADPDARILLCCVELCSLHFQYSSEMSAMIANALFSDGAAALIGVPADPQAEGGERSCWHLAATGSHIVPDTTEAMTWRIGDHGFAMTLSPEVPQIVAVHLGPWLRRWLTEHNSSLDEIDLWAVHPGGPKVLDAVQKALDLPAEALAASRAVLEQYGNMSSATVAFILQRLAQDSAPRPCMMLAFGPGLTIEAALLR